MDIPDDSKELILAYTSNLIAVLTKDSFAFYTAGYSWRVVQITLSVNNIERIDNYTFSHLSNLRHLDFGDNKLTEIKPCILCGCSSLKELIL